MNFTVGINNRENMQDIDKIREEICEIGRRLWQRKLVAAHDGNISVRLTEDRILATPTGFSKGFMTPGDLVLVSLSGEKILGEREVSSEIRMHLEIYQQRPDIGAIVHAHPPHATAFAVHGSSLPANLMPEIDVLLGEVPLVPYCAPGTQEFADLVGGFAQNGDSVFLLKNHGATACGVDLKQAWFRMESLDHCCRILLLARQLGGWSEMG